MEINILTDKTSWLNQYLQGFIEEIKKRNHSVKIISSANQLEKGDLAFFLSCFEIIPPEKLALHKNNLIVHESALPQGKGWSPMTWQIIEGKNEIPIVLFEAVSEVDAGTIYIKDTIKLDGYELIDEWRRKQADKTFDLCLKFIDNYPEILEAGCKQAGESSYYRKRKVEDSKLDITKSIKNQFNLLRTVDNEKYPAYFEEGKKKYIIKIYNGD